MPLYQPHKNYNEYTIINNGSNIHSGHRYLVESGQITLTLPQYASGAIEVFNNTSKYVFIATTSNGDLIEGSNLVRIKPGLVGYIFGNPGSWRVLNSEEVLSTLPVLSIIESESAELKNNFTYINSLVPPLTIEFWMRTEQNRCDIFKIRNSGNTESTQIYLRKNFSQLEFWESSLGLNNIITINNIWNHISLRRNIDNSTDLFLNGNIVASLEPTHPYYDIQFFSNTSYPDFWGNLSELRFWSIARTNQEILNNYKQRLVGNESNLFRLFPLSEGEGNKIIDTVVGEEINASAINWQIVDMSAIFN